MFIMLHFNPAADLEKRYRSAECAYNINFAKGLALFKQLAILGMPLAIYRVGKCAYYGHGTPANHRLGIQLLEHAAALGIVRAYFILSIAYQGTDSARSEANCLIAANAGEVEAQFRMGRICLHKPAPAEALKWFQLAKSNGHPQCSRQIDVLSRQLKKI